MINSEHDLWQLFGGSAAEMPGKVEIPFTELHNQTAKLDVSAKKRGDLLRTRFSVKAKDRFYRLRSSNIEAVVNQARLYATAGKIGDPELSVAYLGVPVELQAPDNGDQAIPLTKDSGAKKRPKKSRSKAIIDSIDKIVTSYFATLAAEPFQYKGKEYLPREVYVSPGIVRGYTCPPMCGGCCPRFSLDYNVSDNLPSAEKHLLTPRMVEFNGRHVEVWSDMQKDHDSPKCRNLNWDDGRCGIHGNQPFSCDFELLRSLTFKASNRTNFTQKLYGRGWAMTRVDGQKKALCEMTPANPDTIADVDRRLARLGTWMKYFGLNPKRVSYIRQHLDQIAETGKPLIITADTVIA